MKNLFFLLCLTLSVSVSIVSCNKNGTGSNGANTMENGIQYTIIKKGSDKAIKDGDHVILDMVNATPKDSVLNSSIKAGQPYEVKIIKPRNNTDLMHMFSVLHEGDSAVFFVSADSMFKTNIPPFAKKGDYMRYYVKINKVQTEQEFNAYKLQASAEQSKADSLLIADYIAKNNLKTEKTASGLHYIMEKEGTGDNPKSGDVVNVHYTGTLLDGTKFDSSMDRNEPFSFPLGQGRVIKGWDEGIALFKKGGKGKLLIPSPLAYGPRSMGDKIKANSVLLFDIELLDFKPAATE